jgi:hypothetical protein
MIVKPFNFNFKRTASLRTFEKEYKKKENFFVLKCNHRNQVGSTLRQKYFKNKKKTTIKRSLISFNY